MSPNSQKIYYFVRGDGSTEIHEGDKHIAIAFGPDTARRIGDALQAASAGPDGSHEYVVVPKQATPEMIAAAVGWRESDPRGELTGELRMFDCIYAAMVAAAPYMPSATEDGTK